MAVTRGYPVNPHATFLDQINGIPDDDSEWLTFNRILNDILNSVIFEDLEKLRVAIEKKAWYMGREKELVVRATIQRIYGISEERRQLRAHNRPRTRTAYSPFPHAQGGVTAQVRVTK